MSHTRLRVIGAGSLAFGETRAFELERAGQRLPAFLIRHREGLFAYENRCPHQGVDLDMGDERFYAEEIDRIYCKSHGAVFRVADGVCDWGPCIGEALTPLAVEPEGDDAWVSWKSEP